MHSGLEVCKLQTNLAPQQATTPTQQLNLAQQHLPNAYCSIDGKAEQPSACTAAAFNAMQKMLQFEDTSKNRRQSDRVLAQSAAC